MSLKKYAPVLIILIVSAVGLLFLLPGLEKRTDVCLQDFSVSKDGSAIMIKTSLSSSMGFIRDMETEKTGNAAEGDCQLFVSQSLADAFNREAGPGRPGKGFFETSRAMENCLFEVSCIVGRRTMDIILFVGIITYLIITAYTGYAAIEKLKGNELSEEKRIQRYWFSFLWNVASGCIVVLLIVMGPATLEETGFRTISFLHGSHRYLAFGTWILCGLLSTVFIFQIAVFLINPTYRDSVSKQIEEKTHSGKVYDRVVNGLIPRTRREKSYFTVTALAAGICEEIVFRGFLLYVLRRIFPELSPFLLAALAGVCFGAAHFYQGIKGVIKTGLLGILFGFLYISTGSLYLCMAVHFLFDISAAFLCEEDKYEV